MPQGTLVSSLLPDESCHEELINTTLETISVPTGMTVNQVRGEVLYTGLIEMHELDT